MASARTTSKRHISFYNKEYTRVCSGINLKSRCTNAACESVRSMGGLVIVQCPDLDTCVYQDVVYGLPCPSCGTVLSPQQFSGVVFVRCEAEVSVADKSELLRASRDETVQWPMEYLGPEIRITVLERESESAPSPSDTSQKYVCPTNGVNLAAKCGHNDCLAFQDNQGNIVVRVGLIESAVFQELIKFRNCPCCNRELTADSFNAVTFLRCRGEIEIGGKVEAFDATSQTKSFKINATSPRAVIRVIQGPVNPSPSPTSPKNVPSFGDFGLGKAPTVGDLGLGKAPTAGALGLGKAPTAGALGLGKAPTVGDLGLGKAPTAGDLGLGNLANAGDLGLGNLANAGDLGLGNLANAGALLEGFENLMQKLFTEKGLDLGELGLGAGGVTPGALKERLDKLLRGNSSGMDPGINFMADCPNTECGSVVIPSGHIVSCKFREAIRGMNCPSCKQALPPARFKGVGLLNCKAKLQINEKESICQAGGKPEIFKINPEAMEVEISVLERGTEAQSVGQLESGKGESFVSVCPGLNIQAMCVNQKCNASIIMIKCPGVLECQYYDLISTLKCPSCSSIIPLAFFSGVTLVKCRAEVTIGSEFHSVNAVGDKTKDFMLQLGGPSVSIKILSKQKDQASSSDSDRKYTKVGDGVNFITFCTNPACLSVQEYEGFVSVKRDAKFIQRGGFAPNRCNYSTEVQQLNCPACGTHLDPAISRGVALVRCKGTIEIAGRPQNFEAKMNDFVEFNLDCSDPRTFVVYKVVSVLPHGQGLNVVFRCPNKSCPGQNTHLLQLKDIVFIKFGTVTGFKVNEAMLAQNCPICTHKIPMDNIADIVLNDCTAVVRMNGKETNYLTGSRIQGFPFEFRDNTEVDILPVTTRDVALMLLDNNPFFSIKDGLNVQAICSNQICEAKRMHEGKVCISCPQVKNSKLSELLSTLSCPSCGTPLHEMSLSCLSLVQCKALLQSAEKKYLIEAASDEVIDFESSLLSSNLSIQVLSLDEDFPDSKESQVNKGSDFSHTSICHGLNFRTSCPNPDCVSIKNHQYVNIMSGHLLDFDYRIAVQSLICPSCASAIPPEEVEAVIMLCCTGEVRIGDRVVKFDYSGNKISTVKIPNDGSKVWIRVDHRTFDVVTHPAFAYSLRPFHALCSGINFRCHCKNPLCGTVKEKEGQVIVQRDAAFLNAHGYARNVCNYRDEISGLTCPDCSHPLKRYFVWGVLFSSCSGTITRNGSPPEKFSTLSGKVVLYALDRDDTSVRIEISV